MEHKQNAQVIAGHFTLIQCIISLLTGSLSSRCMEPSLEKHFVLGQSTGPGLDCLLTQRACFGGAVHKSPCLVAGLIERQMRRALAERQEPIHGLMPEGRDNLRPTIPQILKAFAHYSIVHIRRSDGTMVGRRFAKLDAVQEQILDVLRFPCPDEVFG